jgi:hypothetical protein
MYGGWSELSGDRGTTMLVRRLQRTLRAERTLAGQVLRIGSRGATNTHVDPERLAWQPPFCFCCRP